VVRALRRSLSLLATIVFDVGVVVAIIVALYIAFYLLHANPENGIVRVDRQIADVLAGPFLGLFTPRDPRMEVIVNYGLAAVVYLVAGGVVASIIRRFASMIR
jgi:hypothetical protein